MDDVRPAAAAGAPSNRSPIDSPTGGRAEGLPAGRSAGGMSAGHGAGASGQATAGAFAGHAAGASGMSAAVPSAHSGAGAAGMPAAGAAAAGASGKGPEAGGGAGEPVCPLPSTFAWESGPAIAQPKNGWVSLKDVTHVTYNDKHLVYMTTHDQSSWGSAMFMFDDWPDAASAPQTKTAFGVAPTLFFFKPKQQWVIAYQWGRFKFSYRTSSDPSNPDGWSGEQSLYNTALPSGGTGPIDQTVICDRARCFLYYAGDNGHIYRSSLPIDMFPGEFPPAEDSGIQGTAQNLFEAVQVYAVKGSNQYLMIVEAQGSARYFRAWTANDLAGPWTLLTDTFAARSNVEFSNSWTHDISHGDLIRSNPDETFTIDACDLQMLFQGRDPSSGGDYGLLPYRLGLLKLARQ